MTQLDETFRAQRAQLRDNTVAQAVAIWQRSFENRKQYLGGVLTLMDGADRATATLVSGYLTAKAREVGHTRFKALKLDDYTVAKLRGKTGPDVYGAVYGALYGHLLAGETDEQAHTAAVVALSKLAATDVHLAYLTAAHDWMAGDESISAFRRVPAGTCAYCESAAQGLYHPMNFMPFHENCQCDLEPLFGAAAVAAVGLGFHSDGAGADPQHDIGDGARLDTTGAVPAPPKRRRRRKQVRAQ